MGTQSAAGIEVAVSASQPATFDAAGYSALSYTVVGEIIDGFEWGRTYQVIKSVTLASRGTRKKKGSYDEGVLPLKMLLDKSDAGQVIMDAAVPDDADYSFRITLQNGDKYYLQGLVLDFKKGHQGPDSMVQASSNVEINTSAANPGIVEVLA